MTTMIVVVVVFGSYVAHTVVLLFRIGSYGKEKVFVYVVVVDDVVNLCLLLSGMCAC